MAGGIDWFRWHHGSVNDPKFQLVAKKAGASVAEVVAVWACLLESASSALDRGNAGDPDFEALDCALALDDGKAQRIYERMRDRALIDGDGRISAWERRQPKKEDDTAAERKRRQRTREHIVVTEEESRDVTLSHADVTQCHDREEESREEERKEKEVGAPAQAQKHPTPAFLGDENAELLNGRHVAPLAAAWELPAQWGFDAEALGWKPADIVKEAEKFRQYWVSGNGKGTRRSVKGWRQSWSNWLSKAERFKG